jgi:signal transduction histidine kinase
MRRGLSVRWRLTVAYTVLTVVSATVLLVGIYVLVSQTRHTVMFAGASDLIGGGAAGLPPGGVLTPETVPEAGVSKMVVNARTDGVDAALDGLLWWSGIGLLLTAAVSVGAGWVFAGRVLAPVHTITSRARAISADSLDERVSLGGPHDELREMADTFDSLLERIQHAFEGERRLVATMSHELRTPLANQQAALDVALADPGASPEELRAAAEVALGQSRRANRTIEALLTLARVQSGVEPARHQRVELADLVTEVVDAARAGASGAGLAWRVELTPVTVLGDPALLSRAVANLVDNAAVHNEPGGTVLVGLSAAGGRARLRVSNTGPHVAADVAPELVLPFRRGAVDRTSSDRGVGLGLSIVQAIAEHHAGLLTLTPLESGGLDVELVLPLA